MDESRLQDAVDRVEVRALLEAYADTVSRREWDGFAELFLPDSQVDLDLRDQTLAFTGPTAIAGFISWARRNPSAMSAPPVEGMFRYLAQSYPCRR